MVLVLFPVFMAEKVLLLQRLVESCIVSGAAAVVATTAAAAYDGDNNCTVDNCPSGSIFCLKW